ncbi:uncharacterized protein TEOVI_000470400 [Trypanosoma equiperdum]|nr:hypothetical protein, conserved [Trypanosoma equiperdum]
MGRKTGALFLEAVLFLLAFLPQSFVEADESAECSCDLGDLGDSIEEKAAGLCDDESECRRRAVVIIKKNMEEGGRYAACKAELYKLQEKIKTQETPRDNCAEKEKMWEKQRSELEQEKDECLRTSDAHRTQKQDLEDRVRYMDGLTRAMISEKRFAEERRNISEKENEDLKTRVRVLTHKLGVLTAMVQKLHISHMIKDMGIAMLQAEAKQAAEEMETNHKKDVAAAEERVLQECKEKFCFDSSGNLNAAVFIEHNISKENRSFLLEQLNCSKENQGDTKREWRFWRKGANDSSRPKKSADHSESNGSSHGNNIHLVLRVCLSLLLLTALS